MTLKEYLRKYPLSKERYTRSDVDKIRKHAFQKGKERPGTTSEKQQRYYFAVVVEMIRKFCGYEKGEMHQELGEKFRSYEAHGRTFIRSIMDYTVGEMEDHLSELRRFASIELNIYIPRPNETEFSYEVKK